MKGVQVQVPFGEVSPRRELLYRIGYYFVYLIVMSVLGFVAMITWPLQILHVLLLRKRHRKLNDINQAMVKYFTEYSVYFYILTDERPAILPKF